MPQTTRNKTSHHPSQKKKKKGHAPAHQNTFAYQHNPKSKFTDKILSSPNVGCCRRCHEKIEWRKKYRKYKPRTQPGTCNGCRKRNVYAAYHTVCKNCVWVDAVKKEEQEDPPVEVSGSESDVQNSQKETATAQETSKEPDAVSESTSTPKRVRMCAICVKEPALKSSNEEKDDSSEADAGAGRTRLSLRERKAVERKVEREKISEMEELRRQRRASKQENKDEDGSCSGSEASSESDGD